jgi:hypothetical protein
LKRRWKVGGNEDEEVSSYWMTLRNRDDAENWKKEHWMEIAVEEAMDLSQDRLRTERMGT